MKYAMKDTSGVEVGIHSFLISEIGRSGKLHACDFILAARWIRGWMGSGAGSDVFEKIKISTIPRNRTSNLWLSSPQPPA